jgi:hypothetical protein
MHSPHEALPVPQPLDQCAQSFDDLFHTHIQRRRFREYLAGLLWHHILRLGMPCLIEMHRLVRAEPMSVP